MNGTREKRPPSRRRRGTLVAAAIGAGLTIGIVASTARSANGPPTDRENIQGRQDIAHVPKPLKERLVTMAKRPHTYPAMRVFAEADSRASYSSTICSIRSRSQPNVFTADHPGHQRPRDPDGRQRGQPSTADDRQRAGRARAQARTADRPERPGCVHRHLHGHLGPVRHQQRVGLVRGMDDPRSRRAATSPIRDPTAMRSSAR